MKVLIGLLASLPIQLLHVDFFRTLVAFVRFVYYAKLQRRLKMFYPEEHRSSNLAADEQRTTISHNIKALNPQSIEMTVRFFSGKRSDRLIRPLSVLDTVRERIQHLKVLSIGPRTEGELLSLVAYGFKPRNIHAVDLFSYSPWIDVGDMHDLPYADDSFDVIVAGWALPYSENKKRVADEILRVTRDGGVVAVGATHRTEGEPFSADPLAQPQDILDLFGDHIGQVFLQQDPTTEAGRKMGAIVAIFSVISEKRSDPVQPRAQPRRPSQAVPPEDINDPSFQPGSSEEASAMEPQTPDS